MDLRPRFLMLVDILMFFLGFGLVFVIAFAYAGDDETWEDRIEASTPEVRDRSLSAAVATAFGLDPALAPYALAVTTRSAVVTLSGAVPEGALRRKAEDTARGTSGVKGVENRIEVDPRVKPRPGAPGDGQARRP